MSRFLPFQSQIMRFTNIRYSTTLNDAQYDYLSDQSQEINRMMCFKTFIRLAVMERTTITKHNFSAVLQPGQFIASKVELSMMWECNRKTATRIIQEFNQMGILHSEPTNRTTIHTLKCLSVWFTDQKTVKNSFFVINPTVKPLDKPPRTARHVPPENDVPTADSVKPDSVVPAATPSAGVNDPGERSLPPMNAAAEVKELATVPSFPLQSLHHASEGQHGSSHQTEVADNENTQPP